MRSIHSTWNGCMFKDGCRKTEAQRDALRVAIGFIVAWSYDDGPLAGKELREVIEYAQDQLAKNMIDNVKRDPKPDPDVADALKSFERKDTAA